MTPGRKKVTWDVSKGAAGVNPPEEAAVKYKDRPRSARPRSR
jgi:hypothetical protein